MLVEMFGQIGNLALINEVERGREQIFFGWGQKSKINKILFM